MPVLIVDHLLNDFDEWFPLFSANPPPSVGRWWLLRGTDDPNRVFVIGEFAESETADIEAFLQSDKMKALIGTVNAMSPRPVEVIRARDLTAE